MPQKKTLHAGHKGWFSIAVVPGTLFVYLKLVMAWFRLGNPKAAAHVAADLQCWTL